MRAVFGRKLRLRIFNFSTSHQFVDTMSFSPSPLNSPAQGFLDVLRRDSESDSESDSDCDSDSGVVDMATCYQSTASVVSSVQYYVGGAAASYSVSIHCSM